MPTIAVINASTIVPDRDAAAWVAAIQIQIERDFAPAWGISATLQYVPIGTSPPAHRSWVALLDDADQANALGYHDTSSDGMPLGKVFARTTLGIGDAVSGVLSHELLEMLANPDVNELVLVGRSRFYAKEVCDACEADTTSYQINGVLVSDFVWPSYFQTFLPSGRQFDQLKLLHTHIPAMLPGGYLAFYSGGGWHQIFAEQDRTPAQMMARRPHPGSRRFRMMLGREDWIRSTVETA